MKRSLTVSLTIAAMVLATAPFLFGFGADSYGIAGLNFIGWVLAALLLVSRARLYQPITRTARSFGVDTRFKSLEELLRILIHEVNRKNSALSTSLIERRISTKEELSRTLERVVGLAYQLLEAESAELALIDRDSGLYHSSFVLGRPFRLSAEAMIAGSKETRSGREQQEILVQPISFAGAVLGMVRVGLPQGRLPSPGDQEIVRLVALQGSLALMNAQYSSELVRMKRVSEESVRAKTGFLANLSHEIRGPLGIMLNAVEIVLDGLCGSVSADTLEMLKMVRVNGEHLLELINDVLDYAKVESGKMVPQRVTIVAHEILKDITNVVRQQAEAKKHSLVLRPNEDLLAFACDRRHIRQMLINVLTNAIKYTPDGGTIEVWAERVPSGKVKINIRDTGVGIDYTQRAKVFMAFERVEHAYSMNQVGTGLGMPLTKRLAELNGGTVDFDSVLGKGTQFWLIFQGAAYQSAALEESQVRPGGLRPGRGEMVLLVQPAGNERSMMERYLRHDGFQVQCVNDILELAQLPAADEIAITVVDNAMIDRSPEEMVQTIRARAELGSRPLVVCSSRAFVFDIERYLRAGVDRCLSKPFDLKTLGSVLREVLEARNASLAIPQKRKGSHPLKREEQGAAGPKTDDPLVH